MLKNTVVTGKEMKANGNGGSKGVCRGYKAPPHLDPKKRQFHKKRVNFWGKGVKSG